MGGQEFTVRKQLVQSSVKMKSSLKTTSIAAFSRRLEHQDVIVYVLPKTTM